MHVFRAMHVPLVMFTTRNTSSDLIHVLFIVFQVVRAASHFKEGFYLYTYRAN